MAIEVRPPELRRQTFWITNRSGEKLFIVYDEVVPHGPLALLVHGLGDVHDTAHQQTMERGLWAAGYNVLRWDGSHSWGRSGGAQEHATLTGAYHDLADVVAWAGGQSWYCAPFVLAGYSLGSAASVRLSADQPQLVSRLLLIAPAVAGRLLARRYSWPLRAVWQLTGRLRVPGLGGQAYSYGLVRDALGYDARELVHHLTMPVEIIVGSSDRLTPARHARELYQALPANQRNLTVIASAGHGFGHHLAKPEQTVKQAAKQ